MIQKLYFLMLLTNFLSYYEYMKKLISVKVNNRTYNIPNQTKYGITKKNGEYEVGFVIGVENSQIGMPVLKMRHDYGYSVYLNLNEIKDLRIL
jgi:hypothetical protein